MKRPGMEKLLGGYAAGNLTEAERRALFEAALKDQQLFDALADEEALRELLADPACRRRIAEATSEPRFARWRMLVPAAALAATAALAFFMLRVAAPQAERPRIELAKSMPAPPPEPAAAPARTPRRFAPPPEARRKAAPPIAPPPELAPAPGPAPARLVAAAPPPPPAKPITVEVSAGALALPQNTVTITASKEMAQLDTMRFVGTQLRDAAMPSLKYTLEQKLPGGDFVLADAALPLDGRAALRLKVQPAAAGYLSVLGSRGVLFSAKAEAMREYTVDLPPREAAVSLVLSKEPEQAKAKSAAAKPDAMLAVSQAVAFPGRIVVELKLTYK